MSSPRVVFGLEMDVECVVRALCKGLLVCDTRLSEGNNNRGCGQNSAGYIE